MRGICYIEPELDIPGYERGIMLPRILHNMRIYVTQDQKLILQHMREVYATQDQNSETQNSEYFVYLTMLTLLFYKESNSCM